MHAQQQFLDENGHVSVAVVIKKKKKLKLRGEI
jgi:hypothetical protein